MAVFDSNPWLGNRRVRPSDEDLLTLARYDRAFGDVNVSLFWRYIGYFCIQLRVGAAIAAAGTFNSLELTARFPFKVVGIEAGCESSSTTTTTADIQKNPTGSPDTFATMAGAVDVKTGAGEYQNVPVLDGAEDVEVGDQIRLQVVAVGAGAVVGSAALLHCFRL